MNLARLSLTNQERRFGMKVPQGDKDMKTSFILSITGIVLASTFSFSSFAVGELALNDASINAICECVNEADANGGQLSGNCHRILSDKSREMEEPMLRAPASHGQNTIMNFPDT